MSRDQRSAHARAYLLAMVAQQTPHPRGGCKRRTIIARTGGGGFCFQARNKILNFLCAGDVEA